jgi:hypothetical protein
MIRAAAVASEQAAAVRVPLSVLKDRSITVLCDSYMHGFNVLYDEERHRRIAAKQRLRTALESVDVMGLCVHSTAFEEYRPD